MSATAIIEQLDKLIKLHENLNKLSVQKTEVIKKGDMEALDKFLKNEQKFVKAIEQVERERQLAVASLLSEQNKSDSTSLTDVLSFVTEAEKEKLLQQRERLLQVVQELKDHNSLNQQLIFHSLQYVNLSLDMIRPQLTNMNYDNPSKRDNSKLSRGMFDSRA